MLEQVLRTLQRAAWRLGVNGPAYYCPACQNRVQHFEPYGIVPRPNARCPICGSTERERAQVLMLQRKIFPALTQRSGLRILHFAPEAGIERVLRGLPGSHYTSADVQPGRAMRQLDLTALDLSRASVEFIFISHVLEHIDNDRRAIQEMHRVLSPGGVAFVEVPVLRATTYEDAGLTSPGARLDAFGQDDHVRICGLDYADRLREAGFRVESLSVREEFTADEVRQMALSVTLPPGFEKAMPPRYERHHDVSWVCHKA